MQAKCEKPSLHNFSFEVLVRLQTPIKPLPPI
jgi:hypothetical protein